MANAQVKLRPVNEVALILPIDGDVAPADGTAEALWLAALNAAGLRAPDALNVPVNQGVATATAQYKTDRALVFLSPIDAVTAAILQDKGWLVLDFSEPEFWSIRFAEYPAVFGVIG